MSFYAAPHVNKLVGKALVAQFMQPKQVSSTTYAGFIGVNTLGLLQLLLNIGFFYLQTLIGSSLAFLNGRFIKRCLKQILKQALYFGYRQTTVLMQQSHQGFNPRSILHRSGNTWWENPFIQMPAMSAGATIALVLQHMQTGRRQFKHLALTLWQKIHIRPQSPLAGCTNLRF